MSNPKHNISDIDKVISTTEWKAMSEAEQTKRMVTSVTTNQRVNRIRVFEDLLPSGIVVYMGKAAVADNQTDMIQIFEVNGDKIAMTVSGEILNYLEQVHRDAVAGNDGRRFFNQEERDALFKEYQREHANLRESVARMILDAWRKK